MKKLITTLVFLVRKDELLLAHKKMGHGAGLWNGVGGKVEPNETIEQALVRECQEEIGVEPVQYQKVAVLTFYQLYKGEWAENICHTYMCNHWQGEPTESDEMAPAWFQITELPWKEMWPADQLYLTRLLEGQKLRGTFYFDANDAIKRSEIAEMRSFA